jgi:hypothetical protein
VQVAVSSTACAAVCLAHLWRGHGQATRGEAEGQNPRPPARTNVWVRVRAPAPADMVAGNTYDGLRGSMAADMQTLRVSVCEAAMLALECMQKICTSCVAGTGATRRRRGLDDGRRWSKSLVAGPSRTAIRRRVREKDGGWRAEERGKKIPPARARRASRRQSSQSAPPAAVEGERVLTCVCVC